MANESNKKLIILYLIDVLKEYSDENHPLSQMEILKKFESNYGLYLDRKTIGANIDALEIFGYDIVRVSGKGVYLGSRDYEKSEVQFLIDAVFSSKSIPSKHSKELAEKIYKNLSKHERGKFKYIFKSDEVSRTNNKQLFFNIEVIEQAIEENKKISFTYNRYDENGEFVARKNGKTFIASPYFMVNSRGRYYLVCNVEPFEDIANYKLEMITNIKVLNEPVVDATRFETFKKGLNISKYVNENVYMFGGKVVDAVVKLEDVYAINNVVDWFGACASISKKDNEILAYIKTDEIALTYWCLQYTEYVELLQPLSTRNKIKTILQNAMEKYGD